MTLAKSLYEYEETRGEMGWRKEGLGDLSLYEEEEGEEGEEEDEEVTMVDGWLTDLRTNRKRLIDPVLLQLT